MYHSLEKEQFSILGQWPHLVVYQPFQFNEAQRWWSGRETLVTIMQATGPGQGNDLPG